MAFEMADGDSTCLTFDIRFDRTHDITDWFEAILKHFCLKIEPIVKNTNAVIIKKDTQQLQYAKQHHALRSRSRFSIRAASQKTSFGLLPAETRDTLCCCSIISCYGDDKTKQYYIQLDVCKK